MALAQRSTVTARIRLDSAISKLSSLLEEIDAQVEPSHKNDPKLEERDVRVCRAVRSAFTYYVDFRAWYGADQHEQIIQDASVLEGLFQRAYAVLRRSAYSDAALYQCSVDEKLQLIRRMKTEK